MSRFVKLISIKRIKGDITGGIKNYCPSATYARRSLIIKASLFPVAFIVGFSMETMVIFIKKEKRVKCVLK